jgi:rfaE bifunctional protein nucleotidyltransferase chain/domain
MMTQLASPETKVMTLEQSVKWRQQLGNKKLVVTNGCFDLLHRGHVEYLHEARNLGDALLLLLNSDASIQRLKGPTRPVVEEPNRAYLLASLSCVDAVVVFDSDRCNHEFMALKPDVYVKGGDYTVDSLNPQEREVLFGLNTQINFIPFVGNFSTTNLIEKLLAK